MTEILVVGFPKSGNTWLSRLLSDALDWPVRGIEDARPLAECGADREDGNVIRQLHLSPYSRPGRPVVSDQWACNIAALNGQHKIVHILRDPRDVAVAINHYWGIKNLQHTITRVMAHGEHPLWGCGWSQYVNAWRKTPQALETRYEWLHEDTLLELRRILDRFGLRPVKPLDEVVLRQALKATRERISKDKDEHYAHGKGAQLTNLRGGRVGDWRAEFSEQNRQAAAELFTLELLDLEYEDRPDWYAKKAQEC